MSMIIQINQFISFARTEACYAIKICSANNSRLENCIVLSTETEMDKISNSLDLKLPGKLGHIYWICRMVMQKKEQQKMSALLHRNQ